jgi:hypothetical protein
MRGVPSLRRHDHASVDKGMSGAIVSPGADWQSGLADLQYSPFDTVGKKV